MTGTRPVVLVIDDDPAFVSMMSSGLSEQFTVKTAHGALDGYAVACQSRVDAIVIDVLMPVVDGWTLIQKIKSNPTLARIALLAVTGLDSDATNVEARRLGVRILRKPVSPRELFVEVVDLINAQT